MNGVIAINHSSGASPALSRLLEHTADAVQAVRGGRSLTEIITKVPAELRPGVQALSFHTLRWLGSATEARALLAPKTPPPAVDALLVTALALLWPGETPPYAEHTLVDQAVTAARQRTPAAAGFINAVLRRFVREKDSIAAQVRHSPLGAYNHPLWWIERVKRDWPQDWQALLTGANQRPPMTLRVNARRGTGTAYVQRLAALGRGAQLLDDPSLGGQAVVLAEPCPVQQLHGFAEGEVSVQDGAAQRAARLLIGHAAPRPSGTPGERLLSGHAAPRPSGTPGERLLSGHAAPRPSGTPGDPPGGCGPAWGRPGARPAGVLPSGARVLDACAAPGGKTAHLLELADIDLLALDSDPLRLARVQDTLNRLQFPPSTRAELKAGDARDPRAWWDGRPFDAILLDAPCTASGIVRRHPDVRWLRRAEDIHSLARIQAQMLDALWPLLAPGGRLLYATCSVFQPEGQAQIDAFMQRMAPGTARLDPASPGHLLPSRDNGSQAVPGRSTALQDGFFYALIHKTDLSDPLDPLNST